MHICWNLTRDRSASLHVKSVPAALRRQSSYSTKELVLLSETANDLGYEFESGSTTGEYYSHRNYDINSSNTLAFYIL